MNPINYVLIALFILITTDAFSQGYVIKTKGDFPYLVYSSSARDRLGGAKMTYLDTAILMRANRISNGYYAVQLSKNHEAFIPTDYADVVNTTLNYEYLGGSLKAYGDSAYDYVTFNTNGVKLPYRSVMQVYPSKLIVDVFGIGNNTNWIMHNHNLLKMVKQVSTEQVEDDVYRIIIDLKHEQNWGYRISYDTANYNYLTIRLKHPAFLPFDVVLLFKQTNFEGIADDVDPPSATAKNHTSGTVLRGSNGSVCRECCT